MIALLLAGQVVFTIGVAMFAYHTGRLAGLNRRMAIHYEAFPDCPGRPFHRDDSPEAPW